MCFPLFDTTVCIPGILINDSESVHLCLRITGKDKADSIHFCYFIKEIGENKPVLCHDYPSIKNNSIWKEENNVKDCNAEVDCRLKYLIQDGFINLNLKTPIDFDDLTDSSFINSLKEQLVKFLIRVAKINSSSANKKSDKIFKDIKSNKKNQIIISWNPLFISGPFIWVKEADSFFEFDQRY